MAAYEWKTVGLYNVDANAAAKEILRISEKHGGISPSAIVEESMDENAVLHGCFEWDDEKAAEKYREHQAVGIVRNITVVSEQTQNERVRAFVRVESGYQPMTVVLEDMEMSGQLLEAAMRELEAFRRKYSTFERLRPVFDAIKEVRG